MMDATGPEFEVTVQRSSGTAVVQVAGELDLASAPTLADMLRDLEPPCDRVILDLSRLTFIDSTGLRLAIAEHRRAELDGFDFVVAGATGGGGSATGGRSATTGAACSTGAMNR